MLKHVALEHRMVYAGTITSNISSHTHTLTHTHPHTHSRLHTLTHTYLPLFAADSAHEGGRGLQGLVSALLAHFVLAVRTRSSAVEDDAKRLPTARAEGAATVGLLVTALLFHLLPQRTAREVVGGGGRVRMSKR